MADALTITQRIDLRHLARASIRIYSPSKKSLDRYCPLRDLGLVTIDDIGSDEMQETLLLIQITDAGREEVAR